MLDDDRLASLLARAGTAFEVPPGGPGDILARAAGRSAPSGAGDGDGDGSEEGARHDGTGRAAGSFTVQGPRHRRLAGLANRHRTLSVAACLAALLVLAGAVGALVRSPAHPAVTAAPARAALTTGGGAPATTTTPSGLSARHGTAPAQNARPAGPSFGTSGSAGTTTPTSAPNLPKGAVGQSARIQQTGSVTLTVGHGELGATITQLRALAATEGGFVASSQTQSGATPSGSVTLQIPVDSFATALTRAQALGRPSDLTTKATDVTGQYVDLQARLTALQATVQQYLTILAKATTVGDVLAVQDQIDSVQSQIEQLQGQLQLLTSETSYSTLTVKVGERAPTAPSGPLPQSGLIRAWHASIGGFVAGVEGVVRLAGPVLFALLLLGAAVLGGRALWRRLQRRHL